MHRAVHSYKDQAVDADALIRQHANLIDRCARQLAVRTGMFDKMDDMWTAGALALLDAARRFDGSRGARFETFAAHRIRGAMLDEVRRLDHLPRRLRASTAAVGAARSKLQQQLSREPTTEELCAELDVDARTLAELDAAGLPHAPLDEQMYAPCTIPNAEERIATRQLTAQMKAAIEHLPHRLQLVLSLHYVESLTYREIAEVLGVSEPRVCQLHAQAIQEIRRQLVDQAA